MVHWISETDHIIKKIVVVCEDMEEYDALLYVLKKMRNPKRIPENDI